MTTLNPLHFSKIHIARLACLAIQLLVIFSNYEDQTSNILNLLPELNAPDLLSFNNSFKSAQIMATIFVVMDCIILYVGTNTQKIKFSLFRCAAHLIGAYLYSAHTVWKYEHIWVIWNCITFLPTVSDIGIAILTAKV